MQERRLAVYGATGYTGRLVCAELARRGHTFIIAGRTRETLEALARELATRHGAAPQVRVARVDAPGELDAMLEGVALLINCAGPFTSLGPPVVQAAIRAGAHYLDITGEQPHMSWLLDTCHEEAARNGVALLSGCGFQFAVGDLAAEFALASGAPRVAVCYVVNNLRMTSGTRKSIVRTLSSPGLTYLEGRLVERRPAYRLFDVPFEDGSTRKAVWFPGGEPLLVPRRGGVTWVESCIVLGERLAYLLATVSGVIPAVMKLVRPMADRVADRATSPPGDPGDDANDAAGEAEGSDGGDARRDFFVVAFDPKTDRHFVTLHGGDVYAVTASIVVEAAERLLRAERPRKVGFTSPAALFDARDFLRAVDIEVIESPDD